MRRALLLLLCCLLPLVAAAQQELEIIPLQHRLVEEVLPALRPLLEPGATLSGMNNQLILRASAHNREEIRAALAAIDTPLRSLVIRVTQDRDVVAARRGAAVYGSAGSDGMRVVAPPAADGRGGARIDLRRGDNVIGVEAAAGDRDLNQRSSQSVSVVDGGRAFINVGRSLPLPLRQVLLGPGGAVVSDSVVYRDLGQGFYAVPHVVGDRVTVEISPRSDRAGAGGSIDTQRLSTTVSGRLGEWIALGGSAQQSAGSDRRGLGSSSEEFEDNRSVWLLIEEAP